MVKKSCCYVFENVDSAINLLIQKHKYTKILLLSTCEQNLIKQKDILLQFEVFPIEIVLKKSHQFSVENMSLLFNVNEDVRAIVVFSQSLVDSAKYLASILNLPCYAVMQGVNVDAFTPFCFIKNQGGFDRFSFSCQFNALITKENTYFGNTFLSFIKSAVILVDRLCEFALTGQDLDSAWCFEIKERILDAIKQYKGNDEMLIDNACQMAKLIYNQSNFQLPSFSVAKKLANVYDDTSDLAICLEIMDKVYKMINDNDKKPKMVDYLSRAVEVALTLGVDRLNVTKRLLEQVKSINSFDFSKTGCEINFVLKLFHDMLKLFNVKNGSSPKLSLSIKSALYIAGDTSFGINTLSAVRELL